MPPETFSPAFGNTSHVFRTNEARQLYECGFRAFPAEPWIADGPFRLGWGDAALHTLQMAVNELMHRAECER